MSKFFRRAKNCSSDSSDFEIDSDYEQVPSQDSRESDSDQPGTSEKTAVSKKDQKKIENWLMEPTDESETVEERHIKEIESLQAELANLRYCIVEQDEKVYESLLKQSSLHLELLEVKQKNEELEKEKRKTEEQHDEIIMLLEASKDKKINYIKEDADEKLMEENEKLKMKMMELKADLMEEKTKNMSLMDSDDPVEVHLTYEVKNLKLELAEKNREVATLKKQLKKVKKSKKLRDPGNLEEELQLTRSELEQAKQELAFANEQISMIFESNEMTRQQDSAGYEKQIRELKDRLIAREEEIWELKNK
ncbi:hypothetical protein GCK72_015271 [Caenorhabditis remanei]|uniref:Uncharacterized protein n=1 Tax=Caenorhabditis remanei TaxID=31234 RepID=A0A6A5GW31_CAERE|nr:hypothetical protein GCK72_015271 [Caenorhabditis remanei]KAF1758811.1 hypothetical protein GCK72_015271 [Caenorhabditis remanei]